MKVFLFLAFVFSYSFLTFSQEKDTIIVKDSISETDAKYIALKPTRVAFYSAILPGLGQAYNKKYWKIPFVYGALGTTTYLFIYNNDKYQEYRSLYKQKKIDESSTSFSFDVLQRAQKYHKKNRDLYMIVTAGVYLLQIVEASVNAHLQYHSVDNKLSLSPQLIREPISGNTKLAANLTLRF